MDDADLMLRTAAQVVAGMVLVYAVACRFLRMRGQASLYTLITHLGLGAFAAYSLTEPIWHAPDSWWVITGCASIALLMTSTRGRWIGGLPTELRKRSANETVVSEPDDVAVRCDRHLGGV